MYTFYIVSAVDPAIQFINDNNFYIFTRSWKSSADFSWIDVSMNGTALFLNCFFFLHSFPFVAIGIFRRSNRCSIVVYFNKQLPCGNCVKYVNGDRRVIFPLLLLLDVFCVFIASFGRVEQPVHVQCSDADSC